MNKESLRRNILYRRGMKRNHLLSTVQSMNFYANTKSYLQLDIIFGRSLNHPYSSFFIPEIPYPLYLHSCARLRNQNRDFWGRRVVRRRKGRGFQDFWRLFPIAILMRARSCMSRIRKYKFVECNGTRKHFHTNAVI